MFCSWLMEALSLLCEVLGVLTGEDARRFEENMKNTKPYSEEEKNRIRENYKKILGITKKDKDAKSN